MARNPHDRFFRIAFGHARDTAAWLKEVLPPAITEALAWEDFALVSGDLPDEGSGTTRSDLVFRATLRGRPVLVFVLLEHQRRSDRYMAVRLMTYGLQQLRVWMREHPMATELPLILSVVLHQGPGRWNALLDLRDAVALPDDLREQLAPYMLGQRTILLDLTQHPGRLAVGPAQVRIAIRLLAQRGRRVELLRAMRADLLTAFRDRGPAFREAVQRYTIDTGPEEVLADVVDAVEGREEPMRRTAGDLYDELIATGVAKGKAEGKAEGKVDLLLHLGGRLFGAASDRVRAQLSSLSSEQIAAVADRMLSATTWDEALG